MSDLRKSWATLLKQDLFVKIATVMVKYLLGFTIFICVTLGSHGFIYFTWLHFLHITTHKSKASLAIALFCLSSGFFLATILAHFFVNSFTKFFYIATSLWYGLLVYLLLGALTLWLIKGIVYLIPGASLSKIWLTRLAFACTCLAILYTCYSFHNALDTRITRITVPLKNLPANWAGKQIVQISDFHIDGFWGNHLINKVRIQVNNLQPELILITGDLFDGTSANSDRYLPALRLFHARRGIYFISGNHEIYGGQDHIYHLLRQTNIQILDNKVIHLAGLQLIGVGYPHFYLSQNTPFNITQQKNFQKDLPTILLFHTPTDIGETLQNPVTTHARTYFHPNTSFATARQLGIDLQLSGHTHHGQLVPFNWLTSSIFNGFDYGLHKIGDFHLYASSGVGTWGPPIRSGSHSEIVVITLENKK